MNLVKPLCASRRPGRCLVVTFATVLFNPIHHGLRMHRSLNLRIQVRNEGGDGFRIKKVVFEHPSGQKIHSTSGFVPQLSYFLLGAALTIKQKPDRRWHGRPLLGQLPIQI